MMSKRKRILPKEEKEFLEDKINEAERLQLTEPDADLIREFETLSKQGYTVVDEYKHKYYGILSHNIIEYKNDNL